MRIYSHLFCFLIHPIKHENQKSKFCFYLRKDVFMKRIHSICGIMLGIGITVLNFTNSFAASASGCLDGVNDQNVNGWVWDSSRPEEALIVRAVIKRASDGATVAEFFRNRRKLPGGLSRRRLRNRQLRILHPGQLGQLRLRCIPCGGLRRRHASDQCIRL